MATFSGEWSLCSDDLVAAKPLVRKLQGQQQERPWQHRQ
jgi:hypothetical protein